MSKKRNADLTADQNRSKQERITEALQKELASVQAEIDESRRKGVMLFAMIEAEERELELLMRPEASWSPLKGLEAVIMAYRACRYTVEGLEKPIAIGQVHAEVEAWMEADERIARFHFHRGWALLTAWNPMLERLKQGENEQRNRRLIGELKYYKTCPALQEDHTSGAIVDWVLVSGLSLMDTKFFARKFGQQGFIFADAGSPPKLYVRAGERLPFHQV